MILAAVAIGAILLPARAGAIEVRKMLPTKRETVGGQQVAPSHQAPIPKALQQKLSDAVAQESEIYVDQESEKKADGQPYVDLEHAKFLWLPSKKDGKWNVLAKLEAPEYVRRKGVTEGKGRLTGNRKVLVFNYRLDGGTWTEVETPKWEDVGKKAAAKK
jgi:hypothetical protein